MAKVVGGRVVGLFGRLSLSWTFNEQGLAVLHGPNGSGKSTFLRILEATFNRQMEALSMLPFRAVEVDFDDGRRLRILDRAFLNAEVRIDEEVRGRFEELVSEAIQKDGNISDAAAAELWEEAVRDADWYSWDDAMRDPPPHGARRPLKLELMGAPARQRTTIAGTYINEPGERRKLLRPGIVEAANRYHSPVLDELKDLVCTRISGPVGSATDLETFRGSPEALLRRMNAELTAIRRLFAPPYGVQVRLLGEQERADPDDFIAALHETKRNPPPAGDAQMPWYNKRAEEAAAREREWDELQRTLGSKRQNESGAPKPSDRQALSNSPGFPDVVSFFATIPPGHWLERELAGELAYRLAQSAEPKERTALAERLRELSLVVDAQVKPYDRFVYRINEFLDQRRTGASIHVSGFDGPPVVGFWAGENEIPGDRLSSGETSLIAIAHRVSTSCARAAEGKYVQHIVLLDEPEASLHPTWQRGLLDLVMGFFHKGRDCLVVATHSPDVASSHLSAMQEVPDPAA
ncbi:MAG: AAA family ATPase [Candidatus Thermoplasmatota archaeon]